MPDSITIEHGASGFIVHVDGTQVGQLLYRERGDVVEAYSTYVQPEARRHGVALRLVQALVDWAREEERTIEPTCWYVAKVMKADPGMAALLA